MEEDFGLESINTELGHIDQRTIECDLRAFTHWLNKLADQLNYTTRIAIYTKNLAEKNEKEICLLKQRVDKIEEQIEDIYNILDDHSKRLTKVEGDIVTLNEVINQVNQRVDNLYRWLPVPYGIIDGLGWKFGMGNINVMSDNNGVPSLNIGIFTSNVLEDNDIYFN